jgi:predicted secreted protein
MMENRDFPFVSCVGYRCKKEDVVKDRVSQITGRLRRPAWYQCATLLLLLTAALLAGYRIASARGLDPERLVGPQEGHSGADPTAMLTWSNTYGASHTYAATSVEPTSDGGYIMVSSTANVKTDTTAWVVKLNGDGTVKWQSRYGADAFGCCFATSFAVAEGKDQTFIVAGTTYSGLAGGHDAWLLKLDRAGNTFWQKSYGGSADDTANAVVPARNGGYVVAGSTRSFGAGGSDAWVFKVDSSGNVLWQKAYGGTNDDSANAIIQTRNGGYVVVGSTQSFGAGASDAWVIKLDPSGNIIWQKAYGGSGTDYATSVVPTPDGGYMVAGVTNSFGAGGYDFWVFRLDGSGNLLWQKTYGRRYDDLAYSLTRGIKGGYVIAGSSTGTDMAALVIQIDERGHIIWQNKYGEEQVRSVAAASDGGFIASGLSYQPPRGGDARDRAWVFKLDMNGNLGGCLGSSTTETVLDGAGIITNTTAITEDTAVIFANTNFGPIQMGYSTTSQCSVADRPKQ